MFRKEVYGSPVCIFQSLIGEAMGLVWIDVTEAGQLPELAQTNKLLRVSDGNVVIAETVKDQQWRHTAEAMEEIIRQAPIPLGNGGEGRSLRTGRQQNGGSQGVSDGHDLAIFQSGIEGALTNKRLNRVGPESVVLARGGVRVSCIEVMEQKNRVRPFGKPLRLRAIERGFGTACTRQEDEQGGRGLGSREDLVGDRAAAELELCRPGLFCEGRDREKKEADEDGEAA